MANESGTALDLFSRFYAVVLYHQVGSGLRVRWSPLHGAWLRSRDHARSGQHVWLDEPGEIYQRPDAPTEEDRSAAVSLARSVIQPEGRPFFCQRCWKNDAASHFIAPDVHGEPELYCLQVPAYSVVDSSGGSGQLKHWGSPFGCKSVEHHIDSGLATREPYLGPLAAYVFGQPLPAEEVINRDWCSRCIGAASNVRNSAAARGEDEIDWAQGRVREHVGRLSRVLADFYGST